jgi:hypothetical protein
MRIKQITFTKKKLKFWDKFWIVLGSIEFFIFFCFMDLMFGDVETPEVVSVEAQEVTATPTATPTPTRNWKPYEELTYKIFGEKDGKVAYAIMGCESNYSPTRTHIDEKEASIGLMQINLIKGNGEGAWVHWDKVPGETLEEKIEWLKVPENNLLIAKFIKGSSGFYPWSCFSKKGYLKYL